MFKLNITEDDVDILQAAVENMRAAPDGEKQRARVLDARWRLAYEIEQIAKRAEAARRSAIPSPLL